MEGVLSVGEVYKQITDYYKGTGIKVAVISGDMKQSDIEQEIELFSEGKTDVLISTTIIEVGVNVPNSTVMVIQNAERFRLAQLHQLRGRVGRGSYQSYCILVSQMKNNEKLEVMVNTTNGFEIAEADLKLRGAGDFIGTMPIEVVVEFIENCPKNIVNQVNKKLSFIDFHNGNVMSFVEHLARGITRV